MRLTASNAARVLPPYGKFRSEGRRPLFFAAVALIGAIYGGLYSFFFPFRILELTVPLVAIALIIIWALPDTASAPVRLLGGLFFAFFISMILWPDYLALALPGLPWITIRRLISVPLLATLLICVSTSSYFRGRMREVLGAVPAIWKLVAAFVAIQLLSIALSRDPGLSLDKFIVAQLYWTTLFFAGCYVFRNPGSVSRWAAFLCLMLIPLGLIGVWEWANSRLPWAGRIPSFLIIEDESVQRILTGASRPGAGMYRVQSSFTTSLGYAEYMALTMPFVLHYAFGPFRTAVRLAALAAIPFTFFMITLTDSRLGMVGFFLSFLAYGFFWAALRWRRNRESLFAPAIVLGYPAIFAGFIAATFLVGRLRRMIWGGGEHQFSTDARTEQYRAGLDILSNNPIGHGIGMGAETLGFRNLGGVLTIDTYYLLIALEFGVIGFLVYYALLLTGIVRAGTGMFRPSEDKEQHYLLPAAISLANFFVIKSIFSGESNHPLAFMLLAMVLALLFRARRAAAGDGGA